MRLRHECCQAWRRLRRDVLWVFRNVVVGDKVRRPVPSQAGSNLAPEALDGIRRMPSVVLGVVKEHSATPYSVPSGDDRCPSPARTQIDQFAVERGAGTHEARAHREHECVFAAIIASKQCRFAVQAVGPKAAHAEGPTSKRLVPSLSDNPMYSGKCPRTVVLLKRWSPLVGSSAEATVPTRGSERSNNHSDDRLGTHAPWREAPQRIFDDRSGPRAVKWRTWSSTTAGPGGA